MEKWYTGIWTENHKQGINFPWFSQAIYHKQGKGFKVWAAPPYPNLSWVTPLGFYLRPIHLFW